MERSGKLTHFCLSFVWRPSVLARWSPTPLWPSSVVAMTAAITKDAATAISAGWPLPCSTPSVPMLNGVGSSKPKNVDELDEDGEGGPHGGAHLKGVIVRRPRSGRPTPCARVPAQPRGSIPSPSR
jgi:hypothetical protein